MALGAIVGHSSVLPLQFYCVIIMVMYGAAILPMSCLGFEMRFWLGMQRHLGPLCGSQMGVGVAT